MFKFDVISEFIDKETGNRLYPGDSIEADEARENALKEAGVIGEAITIQVDGPVHDAKDFEEKVEEAAEPEPEPLSEPKKLTYQELKAKAKELGIPNYNRMSKDQLTEEIAKAEADIAKG